MHPVSQSTWLTKEPYNRCAYKCASKNSLFRTLNDLTMCWNSVNLNVVIDAVKERLQKVKILDYIFFRPLQIRQKGGSVEWRGRSKLCFSSSAKKLTRNTLPTPSCRQPSCGTLRRRRTSNKIFWCPLWLSAMLLHWLYFLTLCD